MLSEGVGKCLAIFNSAVNVLLKRHFNVNNMAPLYHCSLLNMSECAVIERQTKFTVIIYNPLPRTIQSWISIPVIGQDHQVVDADTGQLVMSDNAVLYNEIALLAERRAKANSRLVFMADLPAMGFKVYTCVQNPQLRNQMPPFSNIPLQRSNFNLRNEYLGLKFDAAGNIMEIDNLKEGLTANLRQSMCIYSSSSSGAYVFRPETRSHASPVCLRVFI
jgi:hypothetical protein